MTPTVRLEISSTDGEARCGTLHTRRGDIETPAFMPVATNAAIKGLDTQQTKDSGAHILLVNAYHTHLQPGAERIAKLGGLHRFMGWQGGIITDSGGYQVFSLPGVTIDEEGVLFPKHHSQSRRFTPEQSMQVQAALDADIVMAFDQCAPYPCSQNEAAEAVARTLRWLKRCIAAPTRRPNEQALFGIVQGSVFAVLRRQSAEATRTLSEKFDLPGIAIGGLSVGEGLSRMEQALSATMPHLPPEKPRYLMGVGLPEDILSAVEAGVDLLDCVIPTKYGRAGVLFTEVGRLRITQGNYAKDSFPPDTACPCPVCQKYSRAYLHHLFRARELLGVSLASLHNLHFYARLMQHCREAIAENRFASFKAAFLQRYLRNTRLNQRIR